MADLDGRVAGVILAAGKGARMYPFSERSPKPILPILNRPLLTHQIEVMRDSGIAEIHIVVGHLGYQVASTFGDGSRYGVDIHFVEQESMLGLAHAVGALESRVQLPFLLMLGDIYFHLKSPLRPLIDQVLDGRTNANLVSMYRAGSGNGAAQLRHPGRRPRARAARDRKAALRGQPAERLRPLRVRSAHLRRHPPHAAIGDARRVRDHRQHPDPDQRRLPRASPPDRGARPEPDEAGRSADHQPDRAGAARAVAARRRARDDAERRPHRAQRHRRSRDHPPPDPDLEQRHHAERRRRRERPISIRWSWTASTRSTVRASRSAIPS